MNGDPEYAQEFVDIAGGRLGVQIYPEPTGAAGAPVVVIWPAMGVRARYYRPFATALRAAGLAVVVADLRGTGASTPAPSRADRHGYTELADDVGTVLAALKPQLDGRTRLLLGHSLGGQAALLHLALHGADAVDGLALVAVGIPYWRSYPGRRGVGVLPYTQGIAATTALLGVWPGWGFGGRQARGVIRDWAYTARTGRFPRLDGTDTEAAVRAVRTPVLAVSVDDDQYTPHETMDHLCGKLTAAPVTRERYTVAQAGAALDHFTWVRAATPLAQRIAGFASDLPPR
ncbi:alpha/beta fold hydrolase [Micromonospora sp. NPDC000668]|uniref:alpha/beta hydrolase family protein n=1 Tax=Micromonospora sp. NPDC000668 TaxID=3364219 RepID=UPI0036AFEF60